MFIPRNKEGRFRDTLDGLANTIMMGKLVTDVGDNDIRAIPDYVSMGQNGQFGVGISLNQSIGADTPGLIDPARPRYWNTASHGQPDSLR